MSLLAEAADWFKARRTAVRRWYSDDGGRYAFRVDVHGRPMVVCARKYLHDGQASFMTDKVVQRAADLDAYLLLFVQQRDHRLLFHPLTVQQHGGDDPPDDRRRRERGESWTAIDTDHAVTFEAWADGRDDPPVPRPDRDGNITAWGGSDG